jgi:hypothetical protein
MPRGQELRLPNVLRMSCNARLLISPASYAFPIAPAISVQFDTVIDRHAPGNSSFYPIIESARQPAEEIQIAA